VAEENGEDLKNKGDSVEKTKAQNAKERKQNVNKSNN